MRSPDGILFWFWLKGIAGRDLRLAQPRRFWFWFKEIARWDLTEKKKGKKNEKERKKEEERKKEKKRKEKKKETFRVFLYKAYYAKH